MIYIAILSLMPIYPSRPAFIKLLIAKKTPSNIPAENLNHADIFLSDLAIELLE